MFLCNMWFGRTQLLVPVYTPSHVQRAARQMQHPLYMLRCRCTRHASKLGLSDLHVLPMLSWPPTAATIAYPPPLSKLLFILGSRGLGGWLSYKEYKSHTESCIMRRVSTNSVRVNQQICRDPLKSQENRNEALAQNDCLSTCWPG